MVACVFFEIFSKVGPAAANPHHDPLTSFTDEANKELDGGVSACLMQVVELDFRVATESSLGILRMGGSECH
jgi:hypothetical protein